MTAYTLPTTPEVETEPLLTFKIERQSYGLPITNVVRIIEIVTITPLPGAPDIIQGIINLRGKAVPVMDLRYRFGLPPRLINLHTPIILVDVTGQNHLLGLIVDAVEQVFNVSQADLETTQSLMPPGLANQMATHTAHLTGVAKVDRQMILILNVAALLTSTEYLELSQVLNIQPQG